MPKKKVNPIKVKPVKVSMDKLMELIPDPELLLFFNTYIKHNRNATKAYLELHPHVKESSASVIGSHVLARINKKALLYAYGLNEDFYLTQLQGGAEATKLEEDGEGGIVERPDHSVRRSYHKVLGELLGVETKDPGVTINLPSPIYGGKAK